MQKKSDGTGKHTQARQLGGGSRGASNGNKKGKEQRNYARRRRRREQKRERERRSRYVHVQDATAKQLAYEDGRLEEDGRDKGRCGTEGLAQSLTLP
jgi:hypothetical protein